MLVGCTSGTHEKYFKRVDQYSAIDDNISKSLLEMGSSSISIHIYILVNLRYKHYLGGSWAYFGTSIFSRVYWPTIKFISAPMVDAQKLKYIV